ncbi:cytochrome c [Roseovarius azorensis]|uniref:Cytochrome c n=1 Tax=Roseovarius azorensis TaxID=1287727 RepID=A0A1H7N743_9RHOB|nr:cytochrome c family protein [Roseovarius azorensis]SEL19300.1 cytochrome c [Roseovarius azorensis]
MPRLIPISAVVISALSLSVVAPASAGDAEAGEKVFNKCKACHQVGENAKNRAGPTLNGIIGRPAGTAEGFAYSSPMTDSDLVWDETTLAAFLADPAGTLPGNKMKFPGLRKDEDIADVIAFLAGFNPDGTRN